jgi:hypothetical protein
LSAVIRVDEVAEAEDELVELEAPPKPERPDPEKKLLKEWLKKISDLLNC